MVNVLALNSNTQFAVLAVLSIMVGVCSVRALRTTLIIPAVVEAESIAQEPEKEQVFYGSGHPAIWLGSPNNNQ